MQHDINQAIYNILMRAKGHSFFIGISSPCNPIKVAFSDRIEFMKKLVVGSGRIDEFDDQVILEVLVRQYLGEIELARISPWSNSLYGEDCVVFIRAKHRLEHDAETTIQSVAKLERNNHQIKMFSNPNDHEEVWIFIFGYSSNASQIEIDLNTVLINVNRGNQANEIGSKDIQRYFVLPQKINQQSPKSFSQQLIANLFSEFSIKREFEPTWMLPYIGVLSLAVDDFSNIDNYLEEAFRHLMNYSSQQKSGTKPNFGNLIFK
ncbi:hypothetical protein Q4602_03405 [Paraglaciecola chathamensis]|uniref:hypothetical protein n=1 Tax=Paraglaciecola chathamensis TaxID=368405 RepID=UPI002700E678|nr:hypothetical protein [Paraglaciecola chathamensis]MDO6838507.1 hypothetical protein [Paraglaciecola chathamensis]